MANVLHYKHINMVLSHVMVVFIMKMLLHDQYMVTRTLISIILHPYQTKNKIIVEIKYRNIEVALHILTFSSYQSEFVHM